MYTAFYFSSLLIIHVSYQGPIIVQALLHVIQFLRSIYILILFLVYLYDINSDFEQD